MWRNISRRILLSVAGACCGIAVTLAAEKDSDSPSSDSPPSEAGPAEPVAPGARVPNKSDIKALQRSFQQKFRSKRPADRIAALDRLDEVPAKDLVELLWLSALVDPVPDVRQATISRLASWRRRPGVASALCEKLTKTTRKTGMDERTYCVLKALTGSQDPDVQRDVLEYLNEFLGTPRANQALIHTLCDDLGKQADDDAFRSLKLFTQADFFEKNFGFRRCVLQGIVRTSGNDRVTFVIDMIPKLKGLVQFDVIRFLMRVTGQNFKDDAASWKAWWLNQNQKLPKDQKYQPDHIGGGNFYYGLPIGAKRVVFVLDVSGSMRGDKLEAAKRELIQAIRGLDEDVAFSMVIFSRTAYVWKRPLILADQVQKQQAVQAIQFQEARGGTASYDALTAAFDLDPEAIYFVSDGAPTLGKVVEPEDIVAAIQGPNHVRRVSVYSIGIDTRGPNAADFSKFMHSLAETNWGECVEVDN